MSVSTKAGVATLFVLLTLSQSVLAQGSLRGLRDDAIRHMGWIVGNTENHRIQREMKQAKGSGGNYYEVFMRLAPRGSDHQTEAWGNVSLYRDWFEKGRMAQLFNEPEGMRRLQRVLQIIEEIGRPMR